jgi:alcohol dehydrogenase
MAVVQGGHVSASRPTPQWPPIRTPGDAIVKLMRRLPKAMNGSPRQTHDTPLGDDGIGVVLAVGSDVTAVRPGDRVLVMWSSNRQSLAAAQASPLEGIGTWNPERTFDGLQTEFVRVRDADYQLYPLADSDDDEAASTLGDILPNGFDTEALTDALGAGCEVAIVGAGPVGLTALLTMQFHAPAAILVVDRDNGRLAMARRFGATHTVNSRNGEAAEVVMVLTRQHGVDLAIDALGSTNAMAMCQAMLGASGRVVRVSKDGEPIDTEDDAG